MIHRSNHIISRFRWDTSFDNKGLATQLQANLSHWTRNYMPLELNRIFDELCAPEQTWQIASMELDLGTVDYQNLKYDLSRKLRNALKEKLIKK